MKLVLYGDFEPNRLAASYQRAFEQHGCKVIPFDTNRIKRNLAFWLQNRFLHRLTIHNLEVRRRGARLWNKKLLENIKSNEPDLLFILNGDFIMPETIRAVQSSGVKVFIFHPDNPFPSSPNHRPETFASITAADCYFIWSRHLAKKLQTTGAQNVYYLPFAWDPELFPYRVPDSNYDYDIVFIGGWDRYREDILEELAKQFDLKIWGPAYWQNRTRPASVLRTCWQQGEARAKLASAILQRTRIAINVLREQNLPDGTNMRTFELAGCGALALSTRTTGATSILPEGTAALYFSTIDELLEQTAQYLHQDAIREQIIRNAHRIAEQSHKYTDRVKTILQVYDSYNS